MVFGFWEWGGWSRLGMGWEWVGLLCMMKTRCSNPVG